MLILNTRGGFFGSIHFPCLFICMIKAVSFAFMDFAKWEPFGLICLFSLRFENYDGGLRLHLIVNLVLEDGAKRGG